MTVRRLFGQTVGERLISTATRQEDLAARLRDAGLVKWDPSAFSRLIQGKRGVQLEEAIVLCAALGLPLHRLFDGSEIVTLPGGHEVPGAQVRDVIQHGVVQAGHAAATVLDDLAPGHLRPGPAEQVDRDLRITPVELVDRAITLWRMPFADALERRMAESEEAFSGIDPGRPGANLARAANGVTVTARHRRGWLGHHLRRMTEELRNA
jgi:hypothetical protein